MTNGGKWKFSLRLKNGVIVCSENAIFKGCEKNGDGSNCRSKWTEKAVNTDKSSEMG